MRRVKECSDWNFLLKLFPDVASLLRPVGPDRSQGWSQLNLNGTHVLFRRQAISWLRLALWKSADVFLFGLVFDWESLNWNYFRYWFLFAPLSYNLGTWSKGNAFTDILFKNGIKSKKNVMNLWNVGGELDVCFWCQRFNCIIYQRGSKFCWVLRKMLLRCSSYGNVMVKHLFCDRKWDYIFWMYCFLLLWCSFIFQYVFLY